MNEENQQTFEEMEHRAILAKERAEQAQRDTRAAFATIATGALKALSERSMVLYALTMAFGLFAWSMIEPSTIRLVIAGMFSVLVFLPVLWIFKRASNAN